MRLIDADALKERIRRFLSIRSLDDLLPEEKAIVQHIDRMLPVDAVPVRHGRWETDGMMMDGEAHGCAVSAARRPWKPSWVNRDTNFARCAVRT